MQLVENRGELAILRGLPADQSGGRSVEYHTSTGALLRVNGAIEGAFDREHERVSLPDISRLQEITLEVEQRSLPTSGLPSGPGLGWWWMQRCARAEPQLEAFLERKPEQKSQPAAGDLPLVGHAHLDVAWLWTYAEARRKALRTFATAVRQLEKHPEFRFAQSQPQLYAWVEADEPEFFKRVANLAAQDRFGCGVAAMWIEPDCNLLSGESLLRQMLFAQRYCTSRFGQVPEVAWLPDSFGFPNTLPTLLSHAGVKYFATTKLQWNDTTRFPYPQFRWRGPDGSEIASALIAAYDGDISAVRAARAKSRNEPLVAGYGDGGGGATDAMLAAAPKYGKWTTLRSWFRHLHHETLPVHEGELYLEYHRGVFTTHHDVKAAHAELERSLVRAEALAALAVARGEQAIAESDRKALHDVWTIVLRSQFHDVVTGTSIGAVYDDVRGEYAQARALLEPLLKRAEENVPHRARAPVASPGGYRFENEHLHASVRVDGAIVDLQSRDLPNVVRTANVLTAFVDRPKEWEAWNIDRGYEKSRRTITFEGSGVDGTGLRVRFRIGNSPLEMRLALLEGERFLRVRLNVLWNERSTLLRVGNRFLLPCDEVVYGTPHGTIARPTVARSEAERAKFEVPGQRFAYVRNAEAGCALLTLDTYGWNARSTGGETFLGHSLLRGTSWPDENADLGPQELQYAFAPLADSIGTLERLWLDYAGGPPPAPFAVEHGAVLIVACKPAANGDGVIVRLRECDGSRARVTITSTFAMQSVEATDGLERRIETAVVSDERKFEAELPPFGLGTFRVRFVPDSSAI